MLRGDTHNLLPQSVLGLLFWCGFYAAGIIGSLAVYGVLQERIMTQPYAGTVFSYSVFLVFSNRVAAVLFSAVMLCLSGEPVLPQAPIWKYLVISLANVYASTCQYEALKHVSFVVQMLGKSFRIMPVMLWGVAVSGKRYGLRDWLVAAAVTLGIAEFVLTGPISAPSRTSNSLIGFLLLFAYLVLDGATSTFEEKLFREQRTPKYNQMLYVNGLSSLVSLLTLLVTKDLGAAFRFWGAHPAFILDSAAFSASAVAGQFFIFSQVKEFGALVFAATMNLRQVISITVSYVHFHHIATTPQILGLVAVFSALSFKILAGLMKPSVSKLERTPLLPGKDEKSKDLEVAADPKDPLEVR